MRTYLYAFIAVALITGAGGLYLKGQRDAKIARETQDLRDALETHERIDDADIGNGIADHDIEWLRNRAR